MSDRTFALMFLIEDGGVSNAVNWSSEHLKPDNIVMVLDEENLAVWLWFGSKRGLVSKRTALRQAQSLRGHGYTIGKSIVGRGLETIYEIDERKIGRDPETDTLNTKFMELLSRPVNDAGGFVVTFGGSGGEPLPIEEHFETPRPIEMPIIEPKTPPLPEPVAIPKPLSTPMPEPDSSMLNDEPTPIISPSPEIVVDESISDVSEPPIIASEYTDDIVIPEPSPIQSVSGSMEIVQMGCVVMAILSQFKDIWVSRIDQQTISVEQPDGPVARFHIEEGKIKFHEGSFSDIDPSIKNAIKTVFDELIQATKK